MTSLRRRVENIKRKMNKLTPIVDPVSRIPDYMIEEINSELGIIEEGLRIYPGCCITLTKEMIGCDFYGMLPKETFFQMCKECRKEIISSLQEIKSRLEKYKKQGI